jgi:predicted metallopeptidase
MIKYEQDSEIKCKVEDIVRKLELEHVDISRIACFKSQGSSSRRTVARCYALSKIWQKTLNVQAHYIIEVLSEKFDKLSEADKDRVLIHELLHIPKSFGGGFRHHDFVCNRNVEQLYKRLRSL